MKSALRFSLAFFTGMLLIAGAAPVRAATTLLVDDDGMGIPGNCNNPTPTFTTIQAAVTAAIPGDTVKVCRGTYTENVVVDKTIIVKGAKSGIDARTRATTDESIVHSANPSLPIFMLAADNVILNGFLVEGNSNNAGIQTSPTFSGYRIVNDIVRDNVFGIYLHGSGVARSAVRLNLLEDNNRAGSASGNGIYSDQGAVGVDIAANRFEGHTNAGVLFALGGFPQEDIAIKNNFSLNDNTFVNLFGVSDSLVANNRTNDTIDADDFGSAIRLGDDVSGVVVRQNQLQNPGFSGIAIRQADFGGSDATNIDVLNNRVVGAAGSGLDVTSTAAAAVEAIGNVFRNSVGDGIFFGSLTNGNLIRGNTARVNMHHDCHDDSVGTGTAGTANTWINNVGVKRTPNGICRPSDDD
jgi:nitrous oxidase accessory protein NosD